jgi:hypothetical protein
MWNDVGSSNNSNNSGADKIEFVQFPSSGTVRLRVLDDQPVSRWKHWIQAANAGKGLSVTCIGKGCPICAKLAEAKKTKAKTPYNSSRSHMLNTLVRSFTPAGTQAPQPINKVQILDKGNKPFEGLLTIMQQMGDLKNYDVTITQTGEGFNNITYTVLPTFPQIPLTAEELALPKYDIAEITKPLTVEQITQFMEGATSEQVFGTTEDGQSNPESLPQTSTPASQSINIGGQVQFGQ